MKWFVAAMLALLGCDSVYGLTGRDDKDAAVTDAASDGASSDGPTVCDPGPDPTGDDDSDGISNQNDGCPTIEDRGYNEDGDCSGDVCDPCPQIAAPVADQEGDGVGDACDLPGGSVDVARMEGFGDVDEIEPPGLPGWTHDSVGGTLTNASSPTGIYAWANYEITSPFVIETQLRVPAGQFGWNAGIVFGTTVRDQEPDGWMLAIFRGSSTEATLRLFRLANGIITAQNMDQPLVLGQVQRLKIFVAGTLVSIFSSDGGTQSMASMTLSSPLPANTSFGIAVIGDKSVTFEYLYEVHHQ